MFDLLLLLDWMIRIGHICILRIRQDNHVICIWKYSSHGPLQKQERTGTSFLYWLDWKSKQFNWNVTEWKATQPSLRVFSRKLRKWGALQKLQNSIQTLIILWLVYPTAYKLSILGGVWWATILSSSSSKCFYSWSFIWIS